MKIARLQGCKVLMKQTYEKNVLIPYKLFIELIKFFLSGIDIDEDYVKEELEKKMNKMVLRELYTNSKVAKTDEEREASRQKYLDQKGIPENFRY